MSTHENDRQPTEEERRQAEEAARASHSEPERPHGSGATTDDAPTVDRPEGESRTAEDHLERGSGEAGEDEVQERFDVEQERGFVAASDEDAELNKRENESLSLPDPAPLKSE